MFRLCLLLEQINHHLIEYNYHFNDIGVKFILLDQLSPFHLKLYDLHACF
jgi:hypothetical protein